MAIDTKEKRAAVLGVGRPWMRDKFPVATPDEEWRVSSGNAYGGNALVVSGVLFTTSLSAAATLTSNLTTQITFNVNASSDATLAATLSSAIALFDTSLAASATLASDLTTQITAAAALVSSSTLSADLTVVAVTITAEVTIIEMATDGADSVIMYADNANTVKVNDGLTTTLDLP